MDSKKTGFWRPKWSWITVHKWHVTVAFLVVTVLVAIFVICPPKSSGAFYQYFSLVATVVLAVITFWYARHTKQLAQSADKQLSETRKAAEGEMLLRLNELYSDKRTSEAIRFLRKFQVEQNTKSKGTDRNRYALGQAFFDRYPVGSNGDLLRWHLTNFWYTVAVMNEPLDGRPIVRDDLVLRRFGSSLEVIDILEPIEIILGYHLWKKTPSAIGEPGRKREWPVWNLYRRYKRNSEPETIPVDTAAFEQWRAKFEHANAGKESWCLTAIRRWRII